MKAVAVDHRVEWFGRAQDGSLARVTTSVGLVPDLVGRWPLHGLEPVDDLSHERASIDLDLTLTRQADLDRIESDLGLFAAAHLTHLVAVHAALLVWDGAGVLVPGRSFAGKSTLALAAARAGITVASDEYALIDPHTGLAIGVARPLRERAAGGLRRLDVAQSTEPVEIRLVAALTWHEGGPQIEEIGCAEIAMLILANTVCAKTRPRESLYAAAAVGRTARGRSGRRGEAVDTLPLLADSLRS